MSLEAKVTNHFNGFKEKEILLDTTVLAISNDGQVLCQMGQKKSSKDAQSLGALLVGVWQASEAASELLSKDNAEMGLSFQNSNNGFFLLGPTEKNPKVFWAVLLENQVNPGKIKVVMKKLRNHFDDLKILEGIEASKNDSFLFKNITEEEVDDLFSFAGI